MIATVIYIGGSEVSTYTCNSDYGTSLGDRCDSIYPTTATYSPNETPWYIEKLIEEFNDETLLSIIEENKIRAKEILLYWLNGTVIKINNVFDKKTLLFRKILRCNRKGIGLRLRNIN